MWSNSPGTYSVMPQVNLIDWSFSPPHAYVKPPEKFRSSKKPMYMCIAKDLAKMARLRLLDTKTYLHDVRQKITNTKAQNNHKPSLKSMCRRQKRKLCTLLKQNSNLRAKVGPHFHFDCMCIWSILILFDGCFCICIWNMLLLIVYGWLPNKRMLWTVIRTGDYSRGCRSLRK